MSCFKYVLVILIVSRKVTSENEEKLLKKSPIVKSANVLSGDLKPAGSSYSHQYSDWGGNNPGGYGFSVTGFGTIDDKLSNNIAPRYDGYDNSLKNYGYGGYNNLEYNRGTGLGNEGYGIYKGYGGNAPGYNTNRFGSGYGSSGYVANEFGPSEYPSGVYGPDKYERTGFTGNGGYGGYGGNGGLASYSGYNNPYYQGGGHLGYGYYNKKAGFGNIYTNGVTPSLVTGYRGYTRR